MLTDSLKSRLPATSLQLFGIRQIEEENMAACEYTVGLWFFVLIVFLRESSLHYSKKISENNLTILYLISTMPV